MKLSIITETLSPLEIAKRQLDRAIMLFMDEEDFVSSSTLAGASEEILGKILNENNERSCLDIQIECDLKIQDEGVSEKDAVKGIVHLRNYYRNKLKHYHGNQNIVVSIDFVAAELLDRACYNYFVLTNSETEKMKLFRADVLQGEYYTPPPGELLTRI